MKQDCFYGWKLKSCLITYRQVMILHLTQATKEVAFCVRIVLVDKCITRPVILFCFRIFLVSSFIDLWMSIDFPENSQVHDHASLREIGNVIYLYMLVMEEFICQLFAKYPNHTVCHTYRGFTYMLTFCFHSQKKTSAGFIDGTWEIFIFF